MSARSSPHIGFSDREVPVPLGSSTFSRLHHVRDQHAGQTSNLLRLFRRSQAAIEVLNGGFPQARIRGDLIR